jgi:ethanolamine ammonia-lyase small subunit
MDAPDAERNCVCNIRPEGLPHDAAAETVYYLLKRSRQLGVSGVTLKDERSLFGAREEPPPDRKLPGQ